MAGPYYIGSAYGRPIPGKEVVAYDPAGDAYCWVRLARFDDWILLRACPREVADKVRRVRQVTGASTRFPEVS